jgi:uncharacterized protein (DUF2141 family)
MSTFLLVLFLSKSFFVQDDTLTVIATHVQVGKGTVIMAIWNDEKTFLKQPYLSQSLKAASSTLAFSFVLPEGEYAISLFQDINDNKKLDLGVFSIPKEPIGFGNNFRPRFSAPKFKDCAISVTQTTMTEIELK